MCPPKVNADGSDGNAAAANQDLEAASARRTGQRSPSASPPQASRSSTSSWRLTLLSNLSFVIGAALYVRMATISFDYAKSNQGILLLASSAVDASAADTTTTTIIVDATLLYWDQLSAEAKEAAQSLGYTQNIWDTGGIPAEIDLWWDCLSPEQMEAAVVLGYDQGKWDGVETASTTTTTTTTVTDTVEESSMSENVLEAESYPDLNTTAAALRPSSTSNATDDDLKFVRLYIFASLAFVAVGILDWMVVQKLYPILFIVAGIFGFISALFVTRNVRYSIIFNAVSIHFFFLEAMAIVFHRVKTSQGSKGESSADNEEKASGSAGTGLLVFADLSFFVGSMIEMVVSYYYLFDSWADYNLALQSSNVAAQCLWVVCSLVYTASTLSSSRRMNN